ncbi:MAG: hypothetical protein RMJ36_05190 [Candidatus Calescibacterium sp.]|nr:hypothetical protein [Candidatus Calescibacterium sp.]MDW8133029.1 hypothetical protein [Candidatus Calescibacterium sp.]
MLKPKIKHKVSELEQNRKDYSKKTLSFFLIFLILILIGGSFINNYLNKTLFEQNIETKYKGLIFRLETDKDSYSQGEKVTIKVVIHNSTKNRVDIDFLTSEMVYFTVYSYLDLGFTRYYYKVWTTKPSIPLVPRTHRLSLKPGETTSIIKVWDQVDMNGNPIRTGKYKFVAELNTIDKINLSK